MREKTPGAGRDRAGHLSREDAPVQNRTTGLPSGERLKNTHERLWDEETPGAWEYKTTRSLSSGVIQKTQSKMTRSPLSGGMQRTQREREERARNRRAQNDMIGSLLSGKALGAQTESPSRGEKRQSREQGSDRTGGLSGAAMKGALENASGRTENRSSGKAPTTQEHMNGRDRSLSSGETQSPKHASWRTKSHQEESPPEEWKPMGGETEPSLGTPEDNQMKLTERKKSKHAVEVTLQTTQGIQHLLAATFPIGEDDPRRVSGRDLQRVRGGTEDLRKTTADAGEAQQRKESWQCKRLPRTY